MEPKVVLFGTNCGKGEFAAVVNEVYTTSFFYNIYNSKTNLFRTTVSVQNGKLIMRKLSHLIFIMSPPPPKLRGGHISFSADPGRRGQRRLDSLVFTISFESMSDILPDLHGYIIGKSQRAD